MADLRPSHRFGEPLARNGVDAGLRRRGDHVMTGAAQTLDGLRADQAGSADDDDSHGGSSFANSVC